MNAPVLVAGIGNIFLGDDGFGTEVVRQLAADFPSSWAGEPVRVVDYGIRGLHLAYDVLDGCSALVIVDAVPGGPTPGAITVLEVGPEHLGEREFDAHGMTPTAVFACLDSLGGTLPPTYIVGCRPADLSEGIGLSAPVAAAVDDALAVVRGLVDELLLTGSVSTKAGA